MGMIVDIKARQILDSRGNPSVEVDVHLDSGAFGRAAVPSGASTGAHEAAELRDGDKKYYGGKSVMKAVSHVEGDIFDAIGGYESTAQALLDDTMIRLDGTSSKKRLGANAILGVSMAIAKASAQELGLPLYAYLGGARASRMPVPMFNIINGGAHANNGVDFQEFMILPFGPQDFAERLRTGAEVFHALKKSLSEKGLSTGVGDEGGFAPPLKSARQAMDFIMKAIESAGFKPGQDIMLGLDVASTEFYKGGRYVLKGEGKTLTSAQMVSFYAELARDYPLVSLEDGMAEDDWSGWQLLTAQMPSHVRLVGDDLYVTNPQRLARGIAERAGNAILIKPNQIGTVTETLETIYMAQNAGFDVVISHRSGETEDSFIADLAVAVNAPFVKMGAPCRGERTAKYNQLIRIEEMLSESGHRAGASFRLPQKKPAAAKGIMVSAKPSTRKAKPAAGARGKKRAA